MSAEGAYDDAEGQGFRAKGISAEGSEDDDTAGHALRPPPDQIGMNVPVIEDDDTEGHGITGTPRPPVD